MRATLALVALAILLAACGPEPARMAGIVIDVESRSVTQVDAFTLRTDSGEAHRFRVGPLEFGRGAFPATHLREHMALGAPIVVAYVEEGGEKVAVRLTDGPAPRPS